MNLLRLSSIFLVWPLLCVTASPEASVTILTTSGLLQGVVEDGVLSTKGVRFGVAPTGALRWSPPVPFVSAAVQDATKLGPSCIQQFAFATANLTEFLFNNPPPPEDEDCLFLNVWAPSPVTLLNLKPVLFWIYGGDFALGTGSLPTYDGTSFTKNQDIVVVTFNYRTNVFGFPTAPDLPLTGNNLGFLDQELALSWVRKNIIQFGGDPNQITIMGQSAGSLSVAAAITRNQQGFRAGIMLSGAPVGPANVPPDFKSFNDFANAVNCTQSPGSPRLACLKQVPAAVIRSYTNGPSSGAFSSIIDNQTSFGDPIGRILAHQTTRTPLMIGSTQNDSSLFVIGQTNLDEFLQAFLPGIPISADQIRSLYPGLTDIQVIGEFSTDVGLRCPVSLWAATATRSGIQVHRYTYGAVFADTQLFPNAGAWHTSEVPLIFGTFNRTTASNNEAVLSRSLQTAFANFVKDPSQPLAPNWNQYDPNQQTLAELAFNGNVDFDNFVSPVTSATEDGRCTAILGALGLNPGV